MAMHEGGSLLRCFRARPLIHVLLQPGGPDVLRFPPVDRKRNAHIMLAQAATAFARFCAACCDARSQLLRITPTASLAERQRVRCKLTGRARSLAKLSARARPPARSQSQ